MVRVLIAIALTAMTLAGCQITDNTARTKQSYTYKFGILKQVGDRWYLDEETKDIPKKPHFTGFRYGYLITSNVGKSFSTYHRMEIGSPVSGTASRTVTDTYGNGTIRKTAYYANASHTVETTKEKTTENGGVLRVMQFEYNDAVGPYKITIFVDGTKTKEFTFNVYKP